MYDARSTSSVNGSYLDCYILLQRSSLTRQLQRRVRLRPDMLVSSGDKTGPDACLHYDVFCMSRTSSTKCTLPGLETVDKVVESLAVDMHTANNAWLSVVIYQSAEHHSFHTMMLTGCKSLICCGLESITVQIAFAINLRLYKVNANHLWTREYETCHNVSSDEPSSDLCIRRMRL